LMSLRKLVSFVIIDAIIDKETALEYTAMWWIYEMDGVNWRLSWQLTLRLRPALSW